MNLTKRIKSPSQIIRLNHSDYMRSPVNCPVLKLPNTNKHILISELYQNDIFDK